MAGQALQSRLTELKYETAEQLSGVSYRSAAFWQQTLRTVKRRKKEDKDLKRPETTTLKAMLLAPTHFDPTLLWTLG